MVVVPVVLWQRNRELEIGLRCLYAAKKSVILRSEGKGWEWEGLKVRRGRPLSWRLMKTNNNDSLAALDK